MSTTAALTDLLALAIKSEKTTSKKVRQIKKMEAGKIVAQIYPSYIVERIHFLNHRKHAKNANKFVGK